MLKSSNGNGGRARGVEQAFVLGAGLGTRLKRLTEVRPKPLIPVAGNPLITQAFDHLIEAGVQRLIVNTHHRAGHYAEIFPENRYRGTPLTFRHEPVLLETGGGIRNVADLLGDAPFLVYNGDLFSTLPLEPAIAFHLAAGNEVTLILRSHGGPPHIAFKPEATCEGIPAGRVADIRNLLGRAEGTHLFTGIYLVSPRFVKRLPEGKTSVIAAFLQMIREGTPPAAIVVDEGEWWDLGTREQYLQVHRHLRAASPEAAWVGGGARVHPSARLTGATYVGPGAVVGANARLHDSILWDGTKIAEDTVLENCIVTDGRSLSGIHANTDF